MKKKILILFVIISLPVLCFAQLTKLTGIVKDAATGETLPLASVVFKGTTIGTNCDLDGKFSLETKNAKDSLVFSMMGYKPKIVSVVKFKFQVINVNLEPLSVLLNTVVITPGENPAIKFMRKVIANKKNNDRERLDAYQYEAYNKIQLDANNITDKFKNQKILKPFKFIFNYVDTSSVNGKTYLPIFISETLSDVFYRKNPKASIEKVKANKISGINDPSYAQFLGDLVQNVNIYDNYINLFQKNFVSPVAGFGLEFYKYFLLDSARVDNMWCYKVTFRPKRKQEYTFSGTLWINDTTFAVKSIDMQMSHDVNMNFINDLQLSQEYIKVGDYWMLSRDKMIADFNILEKAKKNLGFYGTKTTTYRNFLLNETKDSKFYNQPVSTVVEPDALIKDDKFWNANRHEELSLKEKTIYHMIDTLEKMPIFNTYLNIIQMVTSGYYYRGNFDWGPYMSLLSFNNLEGTRFRIGGHTSYDFSKKIQFTGHVAYGTKDQEFKYNAGALFMLSKNPRRAIGGSVTHDIEQLGTSLNAFREDFLLASLFRRSLANKLSMVDQYKVYYDHEWFTGLLNTISINHRKLYAPMSGPFQVREPISGDTVMHPSISTTEFSISTRFAIGEKLILGEFDRTSLGAKYPIVEFQYGYSPAKLFGSQYEYHRFQIRSEHWFNILTWGWSKYTIEAGKVWGTVPYTLLKIQPGNETYWFDESAFNLMNYYEFVSDKYINFSYTHHFSGLFLNHIPLMRKLKWRELAWVKGVVGTISPQNLSFNVLPAGTSDLRKPYFEAGVGVENIFRFIRVDGVWRLSHLDNPNAKKFGIMVSMVFDL
jgi:hypothetical protein